MGSDARQQGNAFKLHLVLLNEAGMVCLNVALSAEQPAYPDISQIFPAASRMQRAAYDFLGIYAQEGRDHRKWLRHGAWHSGSFPLRKDFDAAASRTNESDDYAFVQVEGQGVHEIPVGPVHGGIISPGTSVFPSSEKEYCVSKSVWVTPTRASRNVSRA